MCDNMRKHGNTIFLTLVPHGFYGCDLYAMPTECYDRKPLRPKKTFQRSFNYSKIHCIQQEKMKMKHDPEHQKLP